MKISALKIVFGKKKSNALERHNTKKCTFKKNCWVGSRQENCRRLEGQETLKSQKYSALILLQKCLNSDSTLKKPNVEITDAEAPVWLHIRKITGGNLTHSIHLLLLTYLAWIGADVSSF